MTYFNYRYCFLCIMCAFFVLIDDIFHNLHARMRTVTHTHTHCKHESDWKSKKCAKRGSIKCTRANELEVQQWLWKYSDQCIYACSLNQTINRKGQNDCRCSCLYVCATCMAAKEVNMLITSASGMSAYMHVYIHVCACAWVQLMSMELSFSVAGLI